MLEPSPLHPPLSHLGSPMVIGGIYLNEGISITTSPHGAVRVISGSSVGDHAATFADLLTVSETANEPPQDEGNSFNSPRNLAMEATYINHNFSQQCLRMVRKGSVWACAAFCQLQLLS